MGELANRLETDEDAAVARQLVISDVMAGLSTAGELIDQVKRLDTTGRRELLDAARQLAGFDSATTIETRQRIEAANAAAQLIAADESPWQTCPARGCNAIPTNAAGAPAPVDVKRWWCPAHVDQAAEGDMQPRPSWLRYSESGAIVEYDPVEGRPRGIRPAVPSKNGGQSGPLRPRKSANTNRRWPRRTAASCPRGSRDARTDRRTRGRPRLRRGDPRRTGGAGVRLLTWGGTTPAAPPLRGPRPRLGNP